MTLAERTGRCPRCGGQTYRALMHQCSTAVRVSGHVLVAGDTVTIDGVGTLRRSIVGAADREAWRARGW